MGRRRKRRTHVPVDDEKVPRSFVIRSGVVGRAVSYLVRDVRKVMEPNTAVKLRERKTNKLKDFVAVASHYGVTHFLIFSQTKVGTNLRIARTPRGPTLTFRISQYSTIKDVLSLQTNPRSKGTEYRNPPLLVLNNFGDNSRHMKLMAAMFQNLFPPINVQTMKLGEAKRVLLLNYDSETDKIDFRHYYIGIKITGVNKSIKRIIQTEVPNLNKYDDISEYILREAHASESDIEDGPDSTIVIPQKLLNRNQRTEQRAVRLTEIGPRMTLQLTKIQNEFCDGSIIYHRFIKKTKEEEKQLEKLYNQKIKEKEKRRKEQEENIKRKQEEKERIADNNRKMQRDLLKAKLAQQKAEKQKEQEGIEEDEEEDEEDDNINDVELIGDDEELDSEEEEDDDEMDED
ncbi:Brix-domain-containing protein [Anaeromyces robustus]|uniref:Brix-domain-containing protein n=1 Tax=Anaeromyces robustus TaxID=1754192 RepID=A0A1Y1X8Y0_9FUNG|nr:Brix-domain-containing protein [Anaeromyces robustus]|eukprot:ORX82220.1 Brix-domain-containing protein [Anaeromyces robustus]